MSFISKRYKNKRKINAIGLMSGTSADGLSISYSEIDFGKKKIKLKAYGNYEYKNSLKKKIIEARNLKLPEIANLNFELGRIWRDMLSKFIAYNKIKDIDVIGVHGQTVYHSSKSKTTLQIGEASFIAEMAKKPVVCDFRPQDIAAAGEGAPLVPFLDEFLYGSGLPVILLNVGGIANISVVGRGIKTYGFDTGPGNTLMDWAVNYFTSGRMMYDRNGEWAAKGKIDYEKVKNLMNNSFFKIKPPKSLDREEFGIEFLKKNFRLNYKNRFDILATLNYFTAYSISYSILRFTKEKIYRLIVSGGGALNPVLMSNLKNILSDIEVYSIEKDSIHPLAKEPVAFSLLAAARIMNLYNNCPYATGAKGPRILGKITAPFKI